METETERKEEAIKQRMNVENSSCSNNKPDFHSALGGVPGVGSEDCGMSTPQLDVLRTAPPVSFR